MSNQDWDREYVATLQAQIAELEAERDRLKIERETAMLNWEEGNKEIERLKAELANEIERRDRAELALGDACMEIPMMGTLVHRIRVLKDEFAAEYAEATGKLGAEIKRLKYALKIYAHAYRTDNRPSEKAQEIAASLEGKR